MIQWGAPQFLPALWILLPAAGVLALLLWRRERRMRLLLAEEAAALLAPGRRPAAARAKAALWFAACALAMVALARPQWGVRWQEARRRGLDILVVLDVSNSMRATDLKPNRLERAKWGVGDLLARLAGDRIGLVAFAGSSFLECPLTTDYAAFSMMLDDVRPGSIPRGGTAVAQALETALRSFGEGREADRAIVLITDGEDHAGGIERAVDALVEKRVRVFAIGVGTVGGGTIPAADGSGAGVLADRSGAVVRTALREDVLERIALATGGAYLSSAADDFGWDRVFERGVSSLRSGERESKLVRVPEERFPLFLAAAVLLLACEALLGERRRPAKRALPAALAVLALCATARAASASGGARAALEEGLSLFEAQRHEEAAERFRQAAAGAEQEGLDPAVARYDRAVALLEAGREAESAAAFEEAALSPDPVLRGQAHFNRGVALALAAEAAERREDTGGAVALLDQALRAYESAMRTDPRDEDPKVNHELVSRRKAELEAKRRERGPQGAAGRRQGEQPERRPRTDREMTPEEARLMLQAIKQRETSQRSRIRPFRGGPLPVDKDW